VQALRGAGLGQEKAFVTSDAEPWRSASKFRIAVRSPNENALIKISQKLFLQVASSLEVQSCGVESVQAMDRRAQKGCEQGLLATRSREPDEKDRF
jgi:hypothetical protein